MGGEGGEVGRRDGREERRKLGRVVVDHVGRRAAASRRRVSGAGHVALGDVFEREAVLKSETALAATRIRASSSGQKSS